ncbi:MAG: chemotaxis protein CheD [Promethearchaeota archaeon]
MTMTDVISNLRENFKMKKGIGLGEMVNTDKPERYCLLGIGTCVAVYMYDLIMGNYMMAHTVLPRIEEFRLRNKYNLPGKFVDVAINLMLKTLIKEKSKKTNIKCKLVGGAEIFNTSIQMGKRNIQTAHELLKENAIPIIAEDVGGLKGRSVMSFNSDATINIRKRGKYFKI